METTLIRMVVPPSLLRRDDTVRDDSTAGRRTYVLTKAPELAMIEFHGQPCLVYYLTGLDLDTDGRTEVRITKSARTALDVQRPIPLNGRMAPTFYRPAPEFVY